MTFAAEAPSTRHEMLDAVTDAYFDLFLRLPDALQGRRAFRRAFGRGREQLAQAHQWVDGSLDEDVSVAILHLMDSAPRAEDESDAILSWLDMLPGRLVSYLEPARYEVLIEEREPALQTGFATYFDWRPMRAPSFWAEPVIATVVEEQDALLVDTSSREPVAA